MIGCSGIEPLPKLEDARLDEVDDRGLVLLVRVVRARLVVQERPHLLHVDRRAVVAVLDLVEVAHTDLAEVTRMVLVEVDAVVVLATGVTATRRMLAVLADAAMAHPQ